MAKSRKAERAVATQDGKIDLVLGGGGIKGYGHIGFLKAIEERRIAVGDIVGVSIGSLVATFYANGYAPDRILTILSGVLGKLDPDMLARALRSFYSPRKLIKGGADLSELFSELCTTYKLVPKDNLKIIAFNVRKREPVVFEGSDYDLVAALTASCCVPGLMRPVWYGRDDSVSKKHGKHHMIDGGIYHPHPTEFCTRRAIVSRLGHARDLPDESLATADLVYHLLEMGATVFTDRVFGRVPAGDIVIRTGLPSVASMNFHPSEKARRKMIAYGYEASCPVLDRAIARGLVPQAPPPCPDPPAEPGTTSGA